MRAEFDSELLFGQFQATDGFIKQALFQPEAIMPQISS